ncbi:MAG: hypothetical protein CO042_02175 [Parcubacteria group bacterium CG_4_9_14_0_2_um_filter_41_8]|nr:MAG: hypothetical protein AUJ34_02485 [Parcubacteria group bacterium CG1_02_41_12]PIP67125.1 MAG: hypothetical protein COW93_01850 [Parcubacteria group bacterium CG22_combo_CG10-13_8_21_14_all_41_9]PIQ79990.1 MAG: hypothetical protein COV79_02665 [Parcubacteria group bacterium CG11_big_fil_rev_8_21_14_0_20_41_14]PIZ81132.1 MAG: hypothetical protein COY02_03095 [Parcubacteria group bacterium CG_4_10_14_0_2_um_filter_41_6]PJC40732.1 MAG: hypothetical protein CO042_02175 [Parcubacteria group ba
MENNYLDNPVTKREFKELEFDFQEFMKFVKDTVATSKEMSEYFELVIKKDKENTEKILSSSDGLSKKLDTFLTEKVALGGRINDQDEEIETIKHRVSNVEVRVGIEPMLA